MDRVVFYGVEYKEEKALVEYLTKNGYSLSNNDRMDATIRDSSGNDIGDFLRGTGLMFQQRIEIHVEDKDLEKVLNKYVEEERE